MFSLFIVLSWATEILHVPHLLFYEPVAFNWHRVLLRTAVVLAIWLWVYMVTKRLLNRLPHLKEFLLLCSWCRKVGPEGERLTLAQYFRLAPAYRDVRRHLSRVRQQPAQGASYGHPRRAPIPMTEAGRRADP